MKALATAALVLATSILLTGCGSREKEQLISQKAGLKAQVQTLEKQVSLLEAQCSQLQDKQAYQMKLDLQRSKAQDELIAKEKAAILADKEIEMKERLLREEQDVQRMARARAWAERLMEDRRIEELKAKGAAESIRKDVGVCAEIVDSGGNRFQVASLDLYQYIGGAFGTGGWRGRGTSFGFDRGGANIKIPFEKVSHADLKYIESEDRYVLATVFLRSGEVLDNCRCSSSWEFRGTYMSTREPIEFDIENVSRVRFYADDQYRDLTISDTAIITRHSEKEGSDYKRTPIIDALLDYSLKEVGADPASAEAQGAKKIAKTAFNPFAPADQLQKDIDDYVQTIFRDKE